MSDHELAEREDFVVVSSIQRSPGSGACEHCTFRHFEGAITHRHRHLPAALAG